MSNRFIINPGTPEAWTIELKPGVNRIGSAEDNDFVLNHPSVSGHHCELTVTDAGVSLKDLGSTNGTFVAQVPITEFKLHNGHRVQLGAVEMVFESKGLPVLPDAVNLPADGAKIMVANPSPAAPPTPPPPPGLRINRPGPAEASSAPSAPPGFSSAASVTPAPAAKQYQSFTADDDISDRKALVRGAIGAVVGGLIGMFIWYFLIRLTKYEIGIVAWGIGGLTGFAARMLSQRGSHLLGVICGVSALVAIIGGNYLATRYFVDAEMKTMAEQQYQSRLQFAQAAINAKTPEELRSLIAAENEEPVTSITDKDIKEFQEEELPDLREFANGKPSKEEYTAMVSKLGLAFVPKWELLKATFSLFTLLWLFLGVGTAYKIGAGLND